MRMAKHPITPLAAVTSGRSLASKRLRTAVGGTAVYQKGPFYRCLRDVLTMNQHVIGTPRTYEMSGRLLLGMDPLRWLF